MTDTVMIALIQMVGSILTTILTAILTVITVKLKKGVTETKETIATLEKNTNSIKDALVKVTGEAEFAKGLKQGEETSKEISKGEK